LATSLADTRTRPSVILIDPHLPKVSKLTAITPLAACMLASLSNPATAHRHVAIAS
jgi:hypothetical protein